MKSEIKNEIDKLRQEILNKVSFFKIDLASQISLINVRYKLICIQTQ